MSVLVAPSGLPLRLGVILNGMLRVLAVRAARDRVLAAMLLILSKRLNRVLARVSAIAARYHLGTLRAAAKPRARPGSQPPPPDPLPRYPAWVVRQAPECAAYGENLRWLLAEPEVAAMIAAAPQLRRLLRPLWRMLQSGPPPPVLRTPLRSPAPLAPASPVPAPQHDRVGEPPPPATCAAPPTRPGCPPARA